MPCLGILDFVKVKYFEFDLVFKSVIYPGHKIMINLNKNGHLLIFLIKQDPFWFRKKEEKGTTTTRRRPKTSSPLRRRPIRSGWRSNMRMAVGRSENWGGGHILIWQA